MISLALISQVPPTRGPRNGSRNEIERENIPISNPALNNRRKIFPFAFSPSSSSRMEKKQQDLENREETDDPSLDLLNNGTGNDAFYPVCNR